MTLEPDRSQIEQFYDAAFRHAGEEGFISLRVFTQKDRKPLFQRLWKAPAKSVRYVIDVAVDNARRAANNEPPAQFAPPICVLKPEAKWRAREEDLLLGLCISIECDEHPDAAQMMLEEILGPATAVVRSGGIWINGGDLPEDKKHLHWRLTKPTRTNEEHARLKRARALAARIVGADTSADSIVHPMRWPGSWHRKDTPRRCELVSLNPDQEIDLDAALAALEANAAPAPAKPEKRDNGAPTDWLITPERLTDHDELLRLVGAMRRAGMSAGAAVNFFRRQLEALTGVDEGKRARRVDELPRMADVADGPEHQAAGLPLYDPWQNFAVPDFPLGILPYSLQNYVATQAEGKGCDLGSAAMSTLAVVSAAIDHRFTVGMMEKNTGWRSGPGLWVLLVGPPSYTKTPIIKAACLPLESLEAQRRVAYEHESRQYEQRKAAGDKNADPPEGATRLVIHNATTDKMMEIIAKAQRDHVGFLIENDEFSGLIGSLDRHNPGSRGGSYDSAFYLKGYDGAPYSYDRIGRGSAYIERLSFSMLCAVQPDRLAQMSDLTSDGLLQRF
jgi:hypothetical protein